MARVTYRTRRCYGRRVARSSPGSTRPHTAKCGATWSMGSSPPTSRSTSMTVSNSSSSSNWTVADLSQHFNDSKCLQGSTPYNIQLGRKTGADRVSECALAVTRFKNRSQTGKAWTTDEKEDRQLLFEMVPPSHVLRCHSYEMTRLVRCCCYRRRSHAHPPSPPSPTHFSTLRCAGAARGGLERPRQGMGRLVRVGKQGDDDDGRAGGDNHRRMSRPCEHGGRHPLSCGHVLPVTRVPARHSAASASAYLVRL